MFQSDSQSQTSPLFKSEDINNIDSPFISLYVINDNRNITSVCMSNITQKQQLTDALNLNHLLTTPAHCY